MADENDDSKTELAAARARIKELNEESAGHRVLAKNTRAELEAAVAAHKAELASFGEKLTAAEQAAQAANEKATLSLRDAALKLAAKDAGIVDLDGLRLLDTSAVKVAEDGTVSIPETFFAKAKEAKPYLFAADGEKTGAQTGSTASMARTPAAAGAAPKTSAKKASEMTDAEYFAARAALTARR